MKLFLTGLALVAIISCNDDKVEGEDSSLVPSLGNIPEPQNIAYSIVAQHPKDTGAYTQGLEMYKGKLFESTGDYARSSIRITDYKTGKVEEKHVMGSNKIFGEGLTILRDTVYQLTWVSNIVYVYAVGNLQKPIKTLKWPKEGWGLTNDGTNLIISDGTNNLYFVNPQTLGIRKSLPVLSYKGPIDNLNELEYIDGFIYANVYGQNYIVKINPANGYIVGVLVFENLLKPNEKIPGRTDEFNGIAYDTATSTMLVTGKRWPKLFEVKLN